MELSGAEDGKITDGDTQGGGTGGNGSGRMETVEGQTNIPSWQEEIVGFQSGKLERFMKENDMEQQSEYTVRDIMHVFRNVIEQRDLCKKTNIEWYYIISVVLECHMLKYPPSKLL